MACTRVTWATTRSTSGGDRGGQRGDLRGGAGGQGAVVDQALHGQREAADQLAQLGGERWFTWLLGQQLGEPGDQRVGGG